MSHCEIQKIQFCNIVAITRNTHFYEKQVTVGRCNDSNTTAKLKLMLSQKYFLLEALKKPRNFIQSITTNKSCLGATHLFPPINVGVIKRGGSALHITLLAF